MHALTKFAARLLAVWVRWGAGILVGAICMAPAARATSVLPPSFDQLIERADYVARVETLAVRSEWRGEGAKRHIVTIVKARVLNRVVGAPPQFVELEFLGGRIGGRSMIVTDQPEFVPGDHDLLFVTGNGRQVCPLVSMMYGRYPVVTDPADATRAVVAREDGSALQSTDDVNRPLQAHREPGQRQRAAAVGAAPAMQVEEFEGRIRARARELGRKDLAP